MATFPLDDYVIDTLLPDLVGHDRKPSAFLVYLFLWRHTRGRGSADVQISLNDITEGTGLSKRSVQDALSKLVRRRLIGVTRETITSIPVYDVSRPWAR